MWFHSASNADPTEASGVGICENWVAPAGITWLKMSTIGLLGGAEPTHHGFLNGNKSSSFSIELWEIEE